MNKNQPFYNAIMEEALRACQVAHDAVYMPELAEKRIKAKNDSYLFTNWWTTPSLRITGTTKGGSKIVLYVQDQTSWNDSEQLKYAREHHRNGAGPFPQEEFDALAGRIDDGKVFKVDYDVLKRSTSEVISVDAALEHPQTIPFLGGEDIAKRYLAKHRKVYGDNIGIWHSDDLAEEPRGRLLVLGYGHGSNLVGDYVLNGNARFLGVRRIGVVGESAPAGREVQKGTVPSLETVLNTVFASSQRFVPEAVRKQYEAAVRRDLRKQYKG
ncbi:MAG: hypothetical protein V2A62_04720 [Candidatus Woesearchaeota archaeon]